MRTHELNHVLGRMYSQSVAQWASWIRLRPLLAAACFLLGMPGGGVAANIAPAGSGILGYKTAIDGNPGTPSFQAGTLANINDQDTTTRVDNWSGGNDLGAGVSYVGVLWSGVRYEQIGSAVLTLAAFADGGWFGPNNSTPGFGGTLSSAYLIEPTVQVSTNKGLTWQSANFTSDYLTALNGQPIAGPAANPATLTATFAFSPPLTNITGFRILGPNGGSAGPDANGFLGVFELDIEATFVDSDGDNMPDAWERAHGLNVGVNDADGDLDSDGLSNYQEYLANTDPQNPDTDHDGYSDGAEVAAGTDPLDASSIPGNLARDGTGFLGTVSASGVFTELYNAGTSASINDGNLNTHVDTFNGAGTDPKSCVGISWGVPPANPVLRLVLTLAPFSDGGWFGPNGRSPAPGGLLDPTYLTEPDVQVSPDLVTWTNVPHISDYFTVLNGHGIGGGPNPNPNPVTATFTLDPPISGIVGVRIVGSEGGVASGGFLGVSELKVYAKTDADADGMDDDWERAHGLVVGVNDAALDPDGDGLTNLREFQLATDPQKADTDGDGLNDGAEVNTYHTNPLSVDTDQDGLTDGAEVNTYLTNPALADTDGDGFTDGLEVAQGSDPKNASSIPANMAFRTDATGLLGTEDVPGGTDTLHYNAGGPPSINDGSLNTHVDTWNDLGLDTLSFVGIGWTNVMATPLARMELTLATFGDGGWFGPNNSSPGVGGTLTPAYLVEPKVQITVDGTTWVDAPHGSDYLTKLNGHGIGGGANPNPSLATATFIIDPPASGIRGVRIIGTEGGIASRGFLGVAELKVFAKVDTDSDGMDDVWETQHGLVVGLNDAALDPDNDALTNLQEYKLGTNPQSPDTDGDGLNDGAEVNTYHTNPCSSDTDADGLTDGAEANTYHTNPLVADTDSDRFPDGQEVAQGSDPLSAASVPSDLAFRPDAVGILGTEDVLGGTDTPVANAGTTANINDGNLTTRVDTWNGASADTLSYVGIVWANPVTNPIVRLNLCLATFFDGGWFGTNGITPGSGAVLTTNEDLAEPIVQVTTDGGITWNPVAFTSDYLTAMEGHPLPAVDFGPPTLGISHFNLTPAQTGITGIRIIGQEGGVASTGFLGVFELAVLTQVPQVSLVKPRVESGEFRFDFSTVPGSTYTVQYKTAPTDPSWQTLTTIQGDGTVKTAADTVGVGPRFYRVQSQ